ncbi:hypothetical protein [Psychrobium sp. 1_MG-2023]|uniref:hypothetical protein n=1 Tax=Psychrobium sp. 1_MG-2023 TaxID=3062624 RepID=UPI0026906700|nr:hypothetical protein [Psychrobium sp. 1_MG-2023]MDP2561658.1 hypothetical protein [Psychrobium sp. 1_MG-2023]
MPALSEEPKQQVTQQSSQGNANQGTAQPQSLPQSLSQQKLTQLLSAMTNALQSEHTQTKQTQPNQASEPQLPKPTVASSPLATPANFNLSTPSAESSSIEALAKAAVKAAEPITKPDLAAIEQVKQLTQQLEKRLPNIEQLTNPQTLASTIGQFMQFEPLSSQSINLSHLGPLASALQLILGGRHAQQGQSLSPELAKHLQKILKKGSSSASASQLARALQLLGSLPHLKPLEDTLTSLTSNIQLYQYQSQDQNTNNQQQYYFSLPTSEQQISQVEGELSQASNTNERGEKQWRLTLLLPLEHQEKIKAVATIQGTSVEIELTCSNPELTDRASFYCDFLSERLKTLGLQANKISCEQGDIPKTLLKRPNQLVEVTA